MVEYTSPACYGGAPSAFLGVSGGPDHRSSNGTEQLVDSGVPQTGSRRRRRNRVGRARRAVQRSRVLPGQDEASVQLPNAGGSSGTVEPMAADSNPATRGRRSRGWALTVHFPDSADHLVVAVFDRLGFDDRVAYCCMQFETCPETGRRHCQGYLYWKQSQRFSAVRSVFDGEPTEGGVRPHIEPAIASPQANRDYCSKSDTAVEGSFREWGTLPRGQGSRLGYKFAMLRMLCRYMLR